MLINYIRSFLCIEAAAFAAAAFIHAGLLMTGYQHREARIAESVIGAVLMLGLVVSAIKPSATRRAGLSAQAFALLGTCVGILTIAIGVGPQTRFDVSLHAVLVALLLSGLVVTARGRLNLLSS